MIYPSTVKNYKVYNNQREVIGTADIVLPKLQFEKNDLKGGALGGSLNLPVSGNVMPMQTTISLHTNTLTGLQMFTGIGGKIRCQSSLEVFDTASAKFNELPETVMMTVVGDEFDLGKRESSVKAVITQMFSVIYLALYFNGQLFWQIDPFSNICIVNGVDLNAQTRANLI